MLNLSQKYADDRPIIKCDYVRHIKSSLNLVSADNNQIFNVVPREDSAISLKDSFIELDFNVTHTAGAHARYADGYQIILVNLGSIAFFINTD